MECPFIWRRKRDSNPRAFWANGFQDRLVVTASIFLRIKFLLDIALDVRCLVFFARAKKSVFYSLRHKTATRSYAVHLLGFTELSRSNLRSFACVNTDSLRLIIKRFRGFIVR